MTQSSKASCARKIFPKQPKIKFITSRKFLERFLRDSLRLSVIASTSAGSVHSQMPQSVFERVEMDICLACVHPFLVHHISHPESFFSLLFRQFCMQKKVFLSVRCLSPCDHHGRKTLNEILYFFRRLCSSDLSVQSDCNASPLLAHNLYQNSSASSQSLLHNPYRHLVATSQQNSSSIAGGLNLSASAASLTPPTTASSSTPTQTITTLSNNLYNNNHLYQHHNATTTLSGSGHHSKHNSSGISGASAAISHHHPTPIEGLTALSSIGSSALHLTNPICGNSNSLTTGELGMSHWLDGGSNSGKKKTNQLSFKSNKSMGFEPNFYRFFLTRIFFPFKLSQL